MSRAKRSYSAFAARAAAAAAAASCAAISAASAQSGRTDDVSPTESVRDRFGKNFEVDGVRVGGLTFYPGLYSEIAYEDNVFATPAKKDDYVATFEARGRLESNWSRHKWGLDARARRAQYFQNDGENATEYGVGTDLRVDVGARSAVILAADVKEGVEPRGSFETPGAASKPVRFMTRGASAEVVVAQTRTRQSLRMSYERATFEDAISGTGAVLPQSFRDGNFYGVSGRFYRRLNAAAEMFAEARYTYSGYKLPQPATLASQDSRGYSGFAGVAFDMDKIARGEVYAGYTKRDFESAAAPDFEGFSAGAKVEWFATPLTTVTVTADRAVRDAAIPGATGYWLNAGSVTVEHELLRRVILVAAAELRQADFNGLDRTDDERRVTLGADYAFRRNVLFGLRFNRLDMNSRGVAARPDFDSNSLRIGVSFRL